MAFRDGSLIPGRSKANHPPIVEAKPSTTAIPKLHQSERRRRRGELPAVVKTESTNMETAIGQESKQPQFMKSIDDLVAFSAAVSVFKRQFDDLQNHMKAIEEAIESKLKSNGVVLPGSCDLHPGNNAPEDTTVQSHIKSIENAIESKLKSNGVVLAGSSSLHQQKNAPEDTTAQSHIKSIEDAIESKLKSNGVVLAGSSSLHPRNNPSEDTTVQNHLKSIEDATESKLKSNIAGSSSLHPRNNASVTVSQKSQEPAETVPETSNKSEAERMCELMCSKGLRKYIYGKISERAKLLEEIPEALKLAKKPAKFVLECIGKFYVQGRRAFTKDSTVTTARQVSLLILESLLLTSDPGEGKVKIKIESSIKNEAEMAAVAWKKRLETEGGLAASAKMDARGLLLLIACYGVPSEFRSKDLLDLVWRSNSNVIAGALRRSPFLVPMISGIVESGIKRGMHIEALEMVYTFGMENKFSASSLLDSFLKMSKDSFERAKRKAKSPMKFKEATEKQIAALSSVMQCMKAHKIDPAKELPGWQIREEIIKLKNETIQLNKEIEQKARSISLMEEAERNKRLYDQQMEEKARSISLMEEAARNKRLYDQQMEEKARSISLMEEAARNKRLYDQQMEEKARSISLMEEAARNKRLYDQQMEEKARSISLIEEAESALTRRLYDQSMKRQRLSPIQMPPVAPSSYTPIYREQSFPSHRDDNSDEISALVKSYLGPSSSFPHRSGLKRSPEYMVQPVGLGRSVPVYQHLPPNCYSPGHGQRHLQQYPPPVHGQQQRPFALQTVYRHSPSEERYLGLYRTDTLQDRR